MPVAATVVEAASRKGIVRIKKTKDGNEYIRAGGIWIRNFTKTSIPFLNINKMYSEFDYTVALRNELENTTHNLTDISDELLRFDKAVIVSDGYNFEKKYKLLSKLPEDVAVLAVNGALSKWGSPQVDDFRAINLYIVNNPYDECMSYFPRKTNYFPSCLASIRTNPKFVTSYIGNIYSYTPSQDIGFGKQGTKRYCIDDYRNPVCAAIGLCGQFQVKKLMLFCCDDSFEDERPAAEHLPNGLYAYPQQIKSHEIIDANLYWLTHQENIEVTASDYSNGPEYVNAEYIPDEESMIEFFKDAVLSGV